MNVVNISVADAGMVELRGIIFDITPPISRYQATTASRPAATCRACSQQEYRLGQPHRGRQLRQDSTRCVEPGQTVLARAGEREEFEWSRRPSPLRQYLQDLKPRPAKPGGRDAVCVR